MLLSSAAGAVVVTFVSTPVPLLMTVPASRCLRPGEGAAPTIRGAAIELFVGATVTLTDKPGGKPSAGADAAAPGGACTTATSLCHVARHVVGHIAL